MDSRIIFEKDKFLINKINWIIENNSESEWIYFNNDYTELINLITNIFKDKIIYVSVLRQNSFECYLQDLPNYLHQIKKQDSFRIWSCNFDSIFEFKNNLNIYRIGNLK